MNSANKTNSKDLLISKLFKIFGEEYYVWLAYELKFHKRILNYEFYLELGKIKSLITLKEKIISWIINTDYPVLKDHIDQLIKNKSHFSLFECLQDLKNDLRSTNFILIFINNYYKEYYLYMFFLYSGPTYSKNYFVLHENFSKKQNYKLETQGKFFLENKFIHLQINILSLLKVKHLNKQNIYDVITNAKKEYYSINYNSNFNKNFNNNLFSTWVINYLHKKNKNNTSVLVSTLFSQKKYKEYIYWYYDSLYIIDKKKYEIEIKRVNKAWEQYCGRLKKPKVKKRPNNDEKIILLMKSKKLTKQKLMNLLIDEAYQTLLEEENHLNIKNDLIAPVNLNQNEIKEETPLITLEKPTENIAEIINNTLDI